MQDISSARDRSRGLNDQAGKSPRWRLSEFGIALAMVVTSGCQGSSEPAVTATGSVDVEGQPLSAAVITFEPISPTTGPNASVPVFGGQFKLTRDAKLHGGDYRVRLSMIPAEMRRTLPTDAGFVLPPDDAVIDPAFDEASQLTCRLTPDAPNQLRFEAEFLDP